MSETYNTINQDAFWRLPTAKIAPTYRLSDHKGSGCFGDPPGYPSYFVQHVYTQYGNTPRRGATAVITVPGVGTKVVSTDTTKDEDYDKTLKALYVPLPIEHPRVQAWIANTLNHFKHCYRDVERPEYGRPGTLVYPVPDYKLKLTFTDDVRWSEEYRAAVRAEMAAFNKQERARAAAIASVNTHQGVLTIRKWYPDFQPELDEQFLPVAPAASHQGDWWEREDVRPTPQTCRPSTWFGPHRAKGWCQYCGYTTNPSGVVEDGWCDHHEAVTP